MPRPTKNKKPGSLLSQADFGQFAHQGWSRLSSFKSGMGIFAFVERQFEVLRKPQKYKLGKSFDRVAWLLQAEDHLPSFIPVRQRPWGRLMCFQPVLTSCPRQQYRQALLSVCTLPDILTRNYNDGTKLYELMCSIAAAAPERQHFELDRVSIPNRGLIPTQTTDHLGEILLDYMPEIVSRNFLIRTARFRGHHSLRKAFKLLAGKSPEQANSAALHIISRHLSPPEMEPEFFQAALQEFERQTPECPREACTSALNLYRRGLLADTQVSYFAQQLGDDPIWQERDRKILAHVQLHTKKIKDLQQHQPMSLELF